MGHYNSFVVRIWTDNDGKMRGQISHVGTRESASFLDFNKMLDFLQIHLKAPVDRLLSREEEELPLVTSGSEAKDETP